MKRKRKMVCPACTCEDIQRCPCDPNCPYLMCTACFFEGCDRDFRMAKIIPINEAEEDLGHPSQDISGRYPQDDFLRSARPEPFSILERKGNHPAVWTRLVKGQHVRYPEADALRVAQHEHKERKLLEAGKVVAA